jgi:hypothetical protein
MDPSLQSLLDRLSGEFLEVREGVRKAIQVADIDPEMALTRSRKVLEYVLREVFERRIKEPPGTRPLDNLIQRLKDGYLPALVAAHANTVRELGNVGTHRFGEAVQAADVQLSLASLRHILEWYFTAERPDTLTPEHTGTRQPVPVDPPPEPRPPTAPDPSVAPPPPKDPALEEKLCWEAAQRAAAEQSDEDSAARPYESYLLYYPQGLHADEARRRGGPAAAESSAPRAIPERRRAARGSRAAPTLPECANRRAAAAGRAIASRAAGVVAAGPGHRAGDVARRVDRLVGRLPPHEWRRHRLRSRGGGANRLSILVE